jgi:hypothetical protein
MKGDAALRQLEKSLVAQIPERVKALRIAEPVYCLRIWYYGTDSVGDRAPSLTLKTEALRQQLLRDKGKKAPHYIWCADEYEDGAGVFNSPLSDATISRLCREWFAQLPRGSLPDDSELVPLREAIQRVAGSLNRLDWRKYAPVTDDFVVFPADGSHSFCGDYAEMVASVPAERIDRLRSQSLLGTDPWWEVSEDAGS